MSGVLLAVLTSFLICSCSGDDSGNEQKSVTIKFAHWYATDHPQHTSIVKFKELVEERTNGAIQVQIFPNSLLGSEDVFDDSVSQGTVEMGSAGTGIQKFSPKIAVTEAPFLFNNWEDARAVLTGEIGKKITDELVSKGNMRCLAITVNGFRQMSSNKSMANMEEMKGQKFRTPNIPHFIQMMNLIGANSVPMAMSEIFSALETKVVDGQENPYPTIATSSFYEVQDYVLESNHMFSPNFWIINNAFYESLSDEFRDILNSSIAEAANYNWDISQKANSDAKAVIESSGTKVIIPNDEFKASLRNSQGPVYEWFYTNKPGAEEVVKAIRAYQAGE